MKNDNKNNDFVEDDSSFDIFDILMRVLKYWYVFVISLSIAWGLAYLKNRSWTPIYKTSARLILGDNAAGVSANSEYNFMQGFSSGYNSSRDMNNQLVLFSSRDIILRTIKKLDLSVDYYAKGRFKTNFLYKTSPFEIIHTNIPESTYGLEFKLIPLSEDSFLITFANEKKEKDLQLRGTYGTPISDPHFDITVKKLVNVDRPVLFRFRNQDDLVDDFYYRLNLEFAKERSSVLEVSLSGANYERDQDFIDMLCLEYQNFSLERKNEAASKTISFIDDQLTLLSDSLMSTEEQVRSFRTKNGIIDMSSYAGQLISKGTTIEAKFTELKLKEDYLNYLSKYLDNNVSDTSIITPNGLVDGESLSGLVSEYTKLNEKTAQLGEKNPYYKIYQNQRFELKLHIYEVLKNMKASLEIEKSNLLERQNELKSGIVSLTDKERTIQKIQRTYKINENYYNFLLQKRADAQIKKASNSADNIILDKARIGYIINGGVKSKIYSSYMLIGAIIPFAFIFIVILLDSTIKTKRDIEKITRFNFIGHTVKSDSTDPIPVLKHTKSLFTERFREIRTRIEFITKKSKGISVMVTSTEPGDGKTYVAINLAATYGLHSKKTLLIDMDYRRPSVCRSLGIKVNKGVSDYLIGNTTLDDIIIRENSLNFDILAAGTMPPNSGELIKLDKMRELIEKMKQEYDYVVIDISPIGLVSDAYTVDKMVDLMLYVVRYNKTNKKFFKTIIRQLNDDGLVNVNILLNDVDRSAPSYGYGYGYGSSKYYYGFKKRNSYYLDRAGYYAEEYFEENSNHGDSK
ncbi:MAG TPA: polysaccharide biosynthesis tyrosine autokinase [Paludibacteraceae bacterium]|nr:polysaccharide biosynthesis tyrosine autokinase [Paludibacteraceae bacterium]HQJ89461.1 polysaccharide biosynthesis tyrosine autokinase [Paludibacteraceae bacterium]